MADVVAGLAVSRDLQNQGYVATVFEAGERIGGRSATAAPKTSTHFRESVRLD